LRLKTNIFLWVFMVTVVPLALLAFLAISYSEKGYLKGVSREITSSLNSIISEIDRRLYYERQMLLSLATGPDMRQYHYVLEQARDGKLHPEFFERTNRLERFLASFQGVVPSFKSIRVLDLDGNTLVKVRYGIGVPSAGEGIESYPYAEEEIEDTQFVRQLRELPPGELSFLQLPESRWDEENMLRNPSMMDAVYPIVRDSRVIGFLVASFNGELVDKILDVVPRLQNGSLLVAELNPDMKSRDGMVLYDDANGLRFSQVEGLPAQLGNKEYGKLWEHARNKPYGEFIDKDGTLRVYYTDYLPYPNQLTSWILAVRVDASELAAPFNRIRVAILMLVVIAIVISLVLANLGARNIARPIVELAQTLKIYADGNHAVRVNVVGGDEIQQMETSFNYMADILERAERERDHAQRLMLQGAKLASIGEMAAGIGHEINNPLNNILSLIKLIKRSLTTDPSRIAADLESLREETLRASEIVKGILNFARQVPPEYTHFRADAWLQETLALVAQSARTRQVGIDLESTPDLLLLGDRVQLQQVLVNLLLNAIQASPRDSRIKVNVQRQAQRVMIRVMDQGSGIAEQDLDRVFDPFFSTKPVGEGSGLGLSISLGIIERHGGELRIENNADTGVTATIILPLAQTETETRETSA